MIEPLNFAQPLWFAAAALIVVAVGVFSWICPRDVSIAPTLLLGLAAVCGAVSLAGPTWTQPIQRAPLEIEGTDPLATLVQRTADAPVPSRATLRLREQYVDPRDVLAAAAAVDFPIDLEVAARDAAVVAVDLPPAVERGSATTAQVLLVATEPMTRTLRWTVNGSPAGFKTVALAAGQTRQTLAIPFPADAERVVEVACTLDGGDDHPANDGGVGGAIILPPRRALVVAPARPKASQLLEEAGFSVEVGALARADRADFDLALLHNVAAQELAPDDVARLDAFVQAGGGLLVVGGREALAVPRLRETPLEGLLPVYAIDPPPRERSTLALLLVIDRSQSMEAENTAGRSRMQLAREAAARAVDQIDPSDQLGVLAFGTDAEWITPLAPAQDAAEIKRQIRSIQPRGRTNLLSALQRARLALEQTPADRRHVILLTDGVPTPGDFRAVARQFAEFGATVSTVAVSAEAETLILEQIADTARGRSYSVLDPEKIADVFARETREVVGETQRQAFRPFELVGDSGLPLAEMPPLRDYAPTSPRAGATVILAARGGDPLLARKSYGKGAIAVFTADPFADWPGATNWSDRRQFWATLAGSLLPQRPAPRIAVELFRGDPGLELVVDARDVTGSWLSAGTAEAQVISPRGASIRVPLTLAAPGRWLGELPLNERGLYQAEVKIEAPSGTAEQAAALAINAAPDELPPQAHRGLIEDLAAVAPSGKPRPQTRMPLWSYPLMAATLLTLLAGAWPRLFPAVGGKP